MVANPDEYDSLNELEVGNYIQRHYIEKEGLQIDFLSKDFCLVLNCSLC